MAELVDATDLKSVICRGVRVRVPLQLLKENVHESQSTTFKIQAQTKAWVSETQKTAQRPKEKISLDTLKII